MQQDLGWKITRKEPLASIIVHFGERVERYKFQYRLDGKPILMPYLINKMREEQLNGFDVIVCQEKERTTGFTKEKSLDIFEKRTPIRGEYIMVYDNGQLLRVKGFKR